MKFSKKSFKRLLCTTLSAVMLTGTMSFGTVFASSGKISDKSYSDLVTYQSDKGSGLMRTYANGSTINSEEGYTYMPTSTNVKDGVTTYGDTNQLATNGFDLDKTGDIMGTFIFKIKTSDNKRNNDVLLLNASDANDYSGQQFTCFIMDQEQRMGSGKTPSWKYTLDQDESIQGQAEKYYTIGLVFKKDYTYDVYVDGVKAVTATIANDNVKAAMDKTQKLYFYFTVRDNSISSIKSDEDIAKYYFKDFIWQKGGGELVAEADKASYSAGDKVKIKFSAPLTAVDTSKVKLFESATGTELNTTGVTYENGVINVPVPADIKSGAEYRIELPEVTDIIGNKLTNDNVYFNAAQGGDTYEIIDTYETFDSVGSGDYDSPTGWSKQVRWESQAGVFSKSVDDDVNGKSLEIGKMTEDKTIKEPNFIQGGLYYPLSKKYEDGKVVISYDIKPKYYQELNHLNSPSHVQASFIFTGYNTALTSAEIDWNNSGDPGTINGKKGTSPARILSAVIGTSMAYPKKLYDVALNGATFDQDVVDVLFGKVKTFTEGNLNESWYNVKVELDLDRGRYTYYLNGEEKFTSDTYLAEAGLDQGIAAIGMAISGYTNSTDQLIDNVKVSHITNKSLGDSVDVFSDDFSGYTKKYWTQESQTTNCLNSKAKTGNDNAWLPQGWGHTPLYGNQSAPVLLPKIVDNEHGTSLEMGIQLDTTDENGKWNGPELYQSLGKRYTGGVLTVGYEVNPKVLISIDDSRLADAKEEEWYNSENASNTFNFTLYAHDYGKNEGTTSSGSEKLINNRGKRVFGIQDKNFAVYKNNTANKGVYGYSSRKAATEGTWYKIKHIIDIDNDSIKTYLGTSESDMMLLGVNRLSDFGEDTLGNKFTEGIGGIGFSINEQSYLSSAYIDNVSVTHSDFVSQKGVSAVRYSDIKDNMYGSATETSTLVNAVAVSFTDTPDDLENKVTISDGVNTIGYTPYFDNETNTYMMNLSELLTADKEYTLTIDGVTFGGEAMETYTHKIKAAEKGVFEISPISLTVNDAKVTGTQALKKGDTVKASVNIINTTGGAKEVAFSTGIYKDKMLDKFDYRAFKLDGSSATGKYAEDTITFTMGDDAADVTKVRAYLWDSMQNMLPYTDSVDINCK